MFETFDIDWRKCNICGWSGTPLETIMNGRRLVDTETGDWSSFTEQLCPKCGTATHYDKYRANKHNKALDEDAQKAGHPSA